MSTATMEEVQSHLPELLDGLAAGDAVVITRDGKPVARLTPELPKGVPIPGRGKGKLVIHSDDNDYLKDFAEYLRWTCCSTGRLPPAPEGRGPVSQG